MTRDDRECLVEIPVPDSQSANGCLIECMADVQAIGTLITDVTKDEDLGITRANAE